MRFTKIDLISLTAIAILAIDEAKRAWKRTKSYDQFAAIRSILKGGTVIYRAQVNGSIVAYRDHSFVGDSTFYTDKSGDWSVMRGSYGLVKDNVVYLDPLIEPLIDTHFDEFTEEELTEGFDR